MGKPSPSRIVNRHQKFQAKNPLANAGGSCYYRNMQIIINVPDAGRAALANTDKLEVTIPIVTDSDKLMQLLEGIVDHSKTTYHQL